MRYKSILTVATGADKLEPALTGASRLALSEDAHLELLAVGVDYTSMAYYDMGIAAAALQMAHDQAQTKAVQIKDAARTALEGQSSGLRFSIEPVVAQLGGLASLVASHARFSDLVVQALPYAPGRPGEDETVVEASLFDGQAPVLALPAGASRSHDIATHIVVAWKESREALNAVRRAMPFLLRAQNVNIAIIDPGVGSTDGIEPGAMLAQMLARHGISTDVSLLARTQPRTSDILASHVRDRDASLLVMGAYSHSRLRQAILGGTTRNMLKMAEVPVFLAH